MSNTNGFILDRTLSSLLYCTTLSPDKKDRIIIVKTVTSATIATESYVVLFLVCVLFFKCFQYKFKDLVDFGSFMFTIFFWVYLTSYKF